MNCIKNAGRYLALLAALVIVLTGFAVVADSTDASTVIDQTGISSSGFKQDQDGTLHVPVSCSDDTATVTLTVRENGNEIKSQTYDVVNGRQTLDISFELKKGDHSLDITVTDDHGYSSHAQTDVHVKKNVWSNIATYAAIVVIAIIVVIIAVVYIRANPRNKPTTTFTELEREKNEAKKDAEMTKTAKKEYGTPEGQKKTDRIKYKSSRRK